PPVEAAIEAVICSLLGADVKLDNQASHYLEAVLNQAMSLREIRAPQNYRRPLPVPLWASLGHLGTVARDADADEQDEPPPVASGETPDKRKAERRRQDQSERDDPLVFNRFEKILSLAEMVNVNRMID